MLAQLLPWACVLLVPALGIAVDHLPPKVGLEGPVTFAVAGDSITAWLNYSYPSWDGYNDPHSWAGYAVDDGTIMLGGYARSGTGVVQVAAAMPELQADVLVIHLGTNNWDMTPAAVVSYLDAIVDASGCAHVVVVGIPPHAEQPTWAASLNTQLAIWAHTHDHTYVYPYGPVTELGWWVPGYTDDGIHPNPSAAAITGPIIADAIHHAASRKTLVGVPRF